MKQTYKRLSAKRDGVKNPDTGRFITQDRKGEGVRLTPFIRRAILDGVLFDIEAEKLKKKSEAAKRSEKKANAESAQNAETPKDKKA